MAQYDINLREYWRIIKKRKSVIIFSAVALCIFSFFFAAIKAPAPLYTSVCSIKYEKQTTIEGLFTRTLSWSSGDDIQTQMSFIKSYPVIQAAAQKLGKIPKGTSIETAPLNPQIAATIQSLQNMVTVSREGFTNILHIEVTAGDPSFARDFAGVLASTYRDVRSAEETKRTSEAIKYIDDQLKKVRQQLRDSEEEFNRFTQENQLVSIDLQSENLLLRVKEIKDEIRKLDEAKSEFRTLAEKLERFIKNPSGTDSNFYSIYANKRYQDTNNKLVELLLTRDSLLEDYTLRHPEVIAISRRIIENARNMLLSLRLQDKEIEQKKTTLEMDLEEIHGKTSELMEKKLKYGRLKRKVDSANEMTVLLEQKNQEALIRRAEKPNEVTIVKPADLPSRPINAPKKAAKSFLGLMMGLILGLVVAFIAETFDTSIGAIEDVEETIGVQVLGIIPHSDIKEIYGIQTEASPGEKPEISPFKQRMQLVSHFSPKSVFAEGFRTLRTNIEFRNLENKLKTIVVTSATPQEGKTTVAVNLAITMAQSGKKTLLVGSDLRKPILSQIFGVSKAPGITDVLIGNYATPDVVKTITDMMIGNMSPDEVMATPGLDNLNIITSGTIPPNPAELIEANSMTDFIQEIKEKYDVIIFDTPPILSTADTTILGTKVDAVLLVYRVGMISRGLLKRSAVQLKQVQSNLMGVILNGMKAEVSPDFHDFKYYKAYYAYGEEGRVKKIPEGFVSNLDEIRRRIIAYINKTWPQVVAYVNKNWPVVRSESKRIFSQFISIINQILAEFKASIGKTRAKAKKKKTLKEKPKSKRKKFSSDRALFILQILLAAAALALLIYAIITQL